MEPTIFRFIIRHTRFEQLILSLMIWAYYPFYLLSLDLPKIIVNKAIQAAHPEGPFILPLFWFDLPIDLEQIAYLLLVSGLYLLTVTVAGVIKYYINVYKGRLGERLLRRLRYLLYQRILRFPIPAFRRVSQGELIPMITQEVEPIGGFAGIAFSDPQFLGGQLIIALGYILYQDPLLGLAALSFYPVQIYIVPRLQQKINSLSKQRILEVRKLSDHIGDSVAGIADIHSNDTSRYELARFTDRLGRIYWIRYELYIRKFFLKFLNNFIDKLTPFFFFSIGGWLVIDGKLEIGALVAVLAAYKDLAGPWRELLQWYQSKEDIRIKYDQVVRQFQPPGLVDEARLTDSPRSLGDDRSLLAANLTYHDEEGQTLVENISIRFLPAGQMAVAGNSHSGKQDLGYLLAGLLPPSSGKVTLGGEDIAQLPEAVIARHIGLVSPAPYFFNGSILANLLYGLKHRPVDLPDPEGTSDREERHARDQQEIARSGNFPLDFQVNWTDITQAGVADAPALFTRIDKVLCDLGLRDDLRAMGLRGTIDPQSQPQLAAGILRARRLLVEMLHQQGESDLIERFDPLQYNRNATVAENLLFGLPKAGFLDRDALVADPFVQKCLRECGLEEDFLRIGKRLCETMIELFADLPPGHDFFDRFSFISYDDLPYYQGLLTQTDRGFDQLAPADRHRLMGLTFRLTVSAHRLGLIDGRIQEGILRARHYFARALPYEYRDQIAFFAGDQYNPSASIQDNILFGKIAYGKPHAAAKLGQIIAQLLEKLALHQQVVQVGLASPVGVGGSRLSQVQRQRLALARAIISNPDILIVNEALSALDEAGEQAVMEKVKALRPDQLTIWILARPVALSQIDHIVMLQQGRVVAEGTLENLYGNQAFAQWARLGG